MPFQRVMRRGPPVVWCRAPLVDLDYTRPFGLWIDEQASLNGLSFPFRLQAPRDEHSMSQHDAQSRLATGNGTFCPGLDETPVRFSEVARCRARRSDGRGRGHHCGRRDPQTVARPGGRAGRDEPGSTNLLLPDQGNDPARGLRADVAADDPRGDGGDGPEAHDRSRGRLFPARTGLASGPRLDSPVRKKNELFSLLYTFLAQMGHREDYRNKLSETYRGGASTSQPMSRIAWPNRGRSSRVSRPACCRR